MIYRTSLASLVTLVSLHAAAMAQDACKDGLIPDRYESGFNYQHELALAQIISSEEEYQKAVEAGAKGIYKVFGAQGTWKQGQSKRDAVYKETNYQVNTEQAGSILMSVLPIEAREQWLKCMLRKSEANLVAYFDQITEDAATLVLKWSPKEGIDPNGVQVEGVETYPDDPLLSKRIKESLPARLLTPREFPFIVPRNADDLRIVVRTKGGSVSVLLPYIPRPANVEIVADGACLDLQNAREFPLPTKTGGMPPISVNAINSPVSMVRFDHNGYRRELQQGQAGCWNGGDATYRVWVYHIDVPAGAVKQSNFVVTQLPEGIACAFPGEDVLSREDELAVQNACYK